MFLITIGRYAFTAVGYNEEEATAWAQRRAGGASVRVRALRDDESPGLALAEEYKRLPERDRNYFTDNIIVIAKEAERTGMGPINGFYRFAMGLNIRELTKTANYLYENKNRGTELWDSLSELAADLWEERKRLCLVKIRRSELKMSFPLAVMLISLILMTSAPALMQIT
jgi:hypothetical protein